MIDPTYSDTVTIGGSNSSYQTNSFPRPTQGTGGRSGLLSKQSLIWQLTFVDENNTAYDISSATATMYIVASNDPSYTPVLLGSGVLSASGGGTTDRVTFTIAKDKIPNDLGAYGKTNTGNAKIYCILEDTDSYLEFYEGVNVYDTQFGGSGGNTPNAILITSNNLGTVLDTLNTPPGSPSTNDAYLIDTSPTGDWASNANNLAIYNGAAWIFTAPSDGDFLYDKDEDAQKRYTTSWSTEDAKPFSDDSPLINNSADTTKQITISAGSISTATTRTITMPDQDIDLTPGTGAFATAAEGDLAATALQDLVDDTTPQLGGDLSANGHQIQWSKGADVASSAALALGTDGNSFDITGTTTITSINTIAIGTYVMLHFDGALTLTHNATDLILPGAANITTAAGDIATFYEYATGDWRCVSYQVAADVPGGGGGAGSGFPSTDNDKTAAYTVVAGDVGENIVFSGLSADVDCTLDVSLLSLGDILGVINEDSTYSVRVVVSNTSTMTLGSTKTDQYLWQGETVLFGGDTSTNARFLARP